MKTCNLCKAPKELGAFSFKKNSKDGYQSTCKDCARDKVNQWYRDNKARALDNNARLRQERQQFVLEFLKTHPCVICGETDPVVLEFDHLSDKYRCISTMIKSAFALKKLEAEMAKCQVLCANCHRRKTARDFGFWRAISRASP